MKLKLIIMVVVVVVVAGVIVAAVHSTKSGNKSNASTDVSLSIPVGSTFATAQSHTNANAGMLPTCLTKDAAAETAVRADDYLIGGKDSAFDLATTMGIIDVPAGTNVDEFIHSYNGKTVTGSITYAKQYGTYNFAIVPSSPTKPYQQWTMTKLMACK